jgi:speckle-type POZ protein
MSTVPAATTSSIVANTAFASHVLKIDGYSRTKGLTTGIHLRSCSFVVGGHPWHISYIPNGSCPEMAEFISVFLVRDSAPAGGPVLSQFTFSLLDRAGKSVPSTAKKMGMTMFAGPGTSRGFPSFFKRETLERSRNLLRDDCFSIKCDITVVTEFRAEDDASAGGAPAFVAVPPSDLPRHLGDLLASGQGADVGFSVDGVDFAAHRCVLAVRSPVFKAELYGAMKEGRQAHCLVIEDMRADVFRNLLHFIYTDTTLPEQTAEEGVLMAQHLLVAADRYGMERLKIICENKLCRHIDVSTLATTLALAEQHRCQGLKDACFEFLKAPGALDAIMATDGFDHLAVSCPSLIKELMSKLAAR